MFKITEIKVKYIMFELTFFSKPFFWAKKKLSTL